MKKPIYLPLIAMSLFVASAPVLAFDQSSPPDSLVVDTLGNIGVGTADPTHTIHVKNLNKEMLLLENTATTTAIRRVLKMSNFGAVGFEMEDRDNPVTWQFRSDGAGNFIINQPTNPGAEFKVNKANGNVTVKGTVTANGVALTSSRSSKTDISAIKPSEVMEKLKKVEVAEWRYKAAAKNDRHISPMAEDFYSLFQLGPDNKHINPNDLASVAIIAAKELQKKSEAASVEMVSLKAENAQLKARLASLEKLVTNIASGESLLPTSGKKVVLK